MIWKGMLFVVTADEYSDYAVIGIMQACEDFDHVVAEKEFTLRSPCRDQGLYLKWLEEEGYAMPVEHGMLWFPRHEGLSGVYTQPGEEL